MWALYAVGSAIFSKIKTQNRTLYNARALFIVLSYTRYHEQTEIGTGVVHFSRKEQSTKRKKKQMQHMKKKQQKKRIKLVI